MVFIGIDPGLKGGIAILHEHGSVLMVSPMPTTAQGVNGRAIYTAIKGCTHGVSH